MHIGIITIGSRGDVQPYIALGAGFKRAGYQVRLLTHGTFAEAVRAEGLEFADLGVDVRTVTEQAMQEAGEAGHSRLMALTTFLRFMRRALHETQPLLHECVRRCWQATQDVDALLFNVLGIYIGIPLADIRAIPAFAAYVQPLTATREFPNVLFSPAPAWLGSLRPTYNQVSLEVAEWISWLLYRGSLGKAVHDVLGTALHSPFPHMRREHTPIFYGFSPQVLPRPVDWPDHCHVSGYWFLDSQATFQPSADLDAFLQAGPKPIYVGFGSMRGADERRLTQQVISALDRCGQRGILLSGWGALTHESLPQTIFAIDAVPHDWLFPRVAAVVHHGGAGTTGAGLRAGLPSLIVPFLADQFFWGRQVYERGLGPQPIEHSHVSAEALAQAISTMVTDQAMRQRAATAGEHIRAEDGVGTVVRLVERSLAGSSRTPLAHTGPKRHLSPIASGKRDVEASSSTDAAPCRPTGSRA
jgi:sterol 3beta-glucosyltransferase